MTFIEAPKSSMASTKVQSPMVHGTEKISGSQIFFGRACLVPAMRSSFFISADTIPPSSTPPFIFFLLCTHNSLRNFAYLGICFMASRSGILISTFRNIFSNSSSNLGFLAESPTVVLASQHPVWTQCQLILVSTAVLLVILYRFLVILHSHSLRQECVGYTERSPPTASNFPNPGLVPPRSRETLHEYWKRFNKLCATCPYHQINEQLLIQYFY
ncbi:hypothetical protein CR513_04994, partial [Mucuna pruriens]